MTDGKLLIEKLLIYAQTFLGLNELDVVYTRNSLLSLFELQSPYGKNVSDVAINSLQVPDELFQEIVSYSLENGICDDNASAELFANKVFDLLTPYPSIVNDRFMSIKENLGSQVACDYLYGLCIKNNYVKKSIVDKNVKWLVDEFEYPFEIIFEYAKNNAGEILNNNALSKKNSKYPACKLCKENEGFYGNKNQTSSANLRTISVNLGGEDWVMQYAEYPRISEHCIITSKEHTAHVINGGTIDKLFDFIELFPSYFIGADADLPLIGATELNHAQFQGGKCVSPLHNAKAISSFRSELFSDTSVEILDYYSSAIRVTGFNRNTVQTLATEIIDAWRAYFDAPYGIWAVTDDSVFHNSTTLVARFLPDNRYCIELILRNNLTTEEYPFGIFNTRPEYQNVKNNNVGLIDTMGIIALSSELYEQFKQIAEILAQKVVYDIKELNDKNDELFAHRPLIEELMKKHANCKDVKKATAILNAYLNKACAEILKSTAVFKKDAHGIKNFNEFMSACGLKAVKK